MIRLLSRGLTLAEVADRVSKRLDPDAPFTANDVRSVLVRTQGLLRETRLLAPAEAAFLNSPFYPAPGVDFDEWLKGPRRKPLASELDGMRSLAARTIEESLEAGDDSAGLLQPEHVEDQSHALRFAEALLRQEETLAGLEAAAADSSSLHAQLEEGDRRRIEELLLSGDGFVSLDSRRGRWRRFADDVGTDPRESVYEAYENRLMGRDVLENAMTLLTPAGRALIEVSVRPADQRFLESTREVSEPIRLSSPWEPRRWWWYRVPVRLGEHFRRSLESRSPNAARDALAGERADASDSR